MYERAWKTLRNDPAELKYQQEVFEKLVCKQTSGMTQEELVEYEQNMQTYRGPHDW